MTMMTINSSEILLKRKKMRSDSRIQKRKRRRWWMLMRMTGMRMRMMRFRW